MTAMSVDKLAMYPIVTEFTIKYISSAPESGAFLQITFAILQNNTD